MLDTTTIAIALIAFVIIVGAWDAMQRRRRARFRPRGSGASVVRRSTVFHTVPASFAATQLDAVMKANFTPRRIMSRGEASVFFAAERALKRLNIKGRVMAQVSLGEILSSPDEAAYRAVNSKRVDILLIGNSGLPLAAIEYQGEGHYQGSAHARDAVKKAALQRAGIAYLEATPQHSAEDIERDIARVVRGAPQPV
ncbi:DUF2726 domain-containing protein [Brevundimonas sp.]|uniref:DUF2726 domain-containing protein n=1 Tax=Brevundimonas sp. TaxID=1871086 RepID=UPI0019AB1D2C|nr:DUF2726 domain-containing protein [Brevundimonas sp.]MBD3836658.1 DUF2726 domain-containing protein [Brevundimonas sp.]